MKRRALLVGVDRYASDRFVDLKYAVEDAFRLRAFVERLRGDGAFESVEMLRDPSDHEVRDALRKAAAGLGQDDLLLFYFAGHGIQQRESKQHLLLCPQADPDVLDFGTNGAVPHFFLDRIARGGPFDCLFVFDACRNEIVAGQRGGGEGMRGSATLRDLGSAKVESVGGACVKLWSCNDSEQASEQPELKAGVFTYSLVESARSLLEAGEPVVINEGFVHTLSRTMQEVAGGSLSQHPQYSSVAGQGICLWGEAAPIAAPTRAEAPPRPPPRRKPPAATWWCEIDGEQTGPLSGADLVGLARAGKVSRNTLVWRGGMVEWTHAGEIAELRAVLPARPPPVSPPFREHTIPIPPPPIPPPFPFPPALGLPSVELPAGAASDARVTTPERQPGEEKTVEACGVTFEFCWCPSTTSEAWRRISGGKDYFLMGSPENEKSRSSDEMQHPVKLTQGFWMGKYPVTQGQYEVVTGNSPSEFRSRGRGCPMETDNYSDGGAFVEALNSPYGTAAGCFRLPTEAQWEYACRAGTTTAFCYGNDLDSTMANFDGRHPYGEGKVGVWRGKTVPVGQFRPSAWGLHDMHGNVWEWCVDWYGPYLTGESTDPGGPSSGSERVVRGGSWDSGGWGCRSAYRYNDVGGMLTFTNEGVGFRVVLSP